jgi:hypothetical protein
MLTASRRLVMVSMAMRKPPLMPRWRSPHSGGSTGPPRGKAFCGQLIFGSPRRSGKPLIADRGKVAGQSQLR